MEKRLPFKDAAEKETLVSSEATAGNIVIEEQNHTDGDFLIFGPRIVPVQPIEDRIASFEARLTALENKP